MSRLNEDDYFQDSTMSFGEHLEELRSCLIRSIAGLVVGCIIGFFLGGQVVELVQRPLKSALTAYYQGRTEKEIIQNVDDFHSRGYGEDIMTLPAQYRVVGQRVLVNPDELGKALGIEVKDISDDKTNPCNDIGTAEKEMSAEEFLEKSKRWTFADYFSVEKWSAWCSASWKSKGVDVNEDVSKTVLEQKKKDVSSGTVAAGGTTAAGGTPAAGGTTTADGTVAADGTTAAVSKRSRLVSIYIWKPTAQDERTQVKNFAVQETFMIYLKASLVAGLILSSPWIFWQIWSFVAAGLYPHEKHYVHVFLPFSLALFLGGNALAFFFVFEPVLQYLFSFNEWMGIAPDPRISEWLGFFLFLPIGFGVSFQLPLVMLFLERIGVCSLKMYTGYWRVAILVIFFLSMVLTPADPTSMVLMAIPLSFLYLGGIILCKIFPKRKNPYITDAA